MDNNLHKRRRNCKRSSLTADLRILWTVLQFDFIILNFLLTLKRLGILINLDLWSSTFLVFSPSLHSTQRNTKVPLSSSFPIHNIRETCTKGQRLLISWRHYCQLLYKCAWCCVRCWRWTNHPVDFFSCSEGRWRIMKAQIACYCAAMGSRRLDHFLFVEQLQFSFHIKSERLGKDWERAVFVGMKGRGG